MGQHSEDTTLQCANHEDRRAIGTCNSCTTPGCHACLDTSLTCIGPMKAAPNDELYICARCDLEDLVAAVQRRIKRSWFYLVTGGVFGLLMSFAFLSIEPMTTALVSLIYTPLFAYMFWATYWGYFGVRSSLGRTTAQLIFLLAFPIIGGVSALGFGPIQFLKHRRLLHETEGPLEEVSLSQPVAAPLDWVEREYIECVRHRPRRAGASAA